MRYACLLCCFILLNTLLTAQSVLHITVSDDTGEKLIGANVTMKGTVYGAVTGIDGVARLTVPPGQYTVTVNYTGYAEWTRADVLLRAGDTTRLEVVMEEGQVLSEVVVIGYATARKRSVTSAITTVSGKARGRKNRSVKAAAAEPQRGTRAEDSPRPAAGQLTAGHWRDIDNKDFWKDMLAEDFDQWKRHWQLYPEQVIELELVNAQRRPLIDAEVLLYRRADGTELWRARTDNRGRVALWTDPSQPGGERLPVRAEAVFQGRTYPLDTKAKPGHQRERLVVPVGCAVAPVIELAFAIDVSGSMKDELRFLQSELTDVVERVSAQHADKTVRTAAVAYQSPGDAYITKVSPFTTATDATTAFFRSTRADGGKGGAEAVELAFERALELDWSPRAVARVLFILLDEPPEHDALRREKLQRYSREMARRGIKVVPVVSSGAQRDLEYLMRAVSVLTNGTYAFLTDHSGIGDAHLEPAVDSYEVYALNDLLVKIIDDFAAYERCTDLPIVERTPVVPAVRVHPNPVADVLYLDGGDGPVRARLLDAAGQEIRPSTEAVTEMDLSDLAPGIYFVEIQQGKQAWVERIVVAR